MKEIVPKEGLASESGTFDTRRKRRRKRRNERVPSPPICTCCFEPALAGRITAAQGRTRGLDHKRQGRHAGQTGRHHHINGHQQIVLAHISQELSAGAVPPNSEVETL